ncbi:MAG TPA: phosphotransferase family protein [Mycobacteriales bacterium]|nr:phosphotransferase family protein [Mycobacteriales bacterium]
MSTPSEDVTALAERAAPHHAVGAYLAAELGDDGWRDCTLELVAGGRSNLTFYVSSAAGRAVLRRPPLSNRLPTAHDMAREHRVITALGRTPVPVPKTLALCADDEVIGAPFYVMDRVEGYVVRDVLPEGYATEDAERRAIATGLIDVLAELHAVEPAAIGLADYGRPEGYLSRQIRRWTTQWEATRESDPSGGAELDRLAERLTAEVPGSPSGPVVHGDYRMDNVLLDPATPGKVAAVLDWELSTLGDPLADVGLFFVYWQESADDEAYRAAHLLPSVTRLPGFPSRHELIERYAASTGRDLSALPWYVGFACFKLAVVLAGVAARGRAGAMIGDGFVEMGSRIAPLVAIGHRALSGDLV